MLGSVNAMQHQAQPQQQQQQQQPPQQQTQTANLQPPPPPPPLNGQDINLSNILHFLQSEWRRYERERNEWEIERAEMRARIALLEGERRSFENTRMDLLRRIKMLEYALRMERSKQLSQTSQSINPAKTTTVQSQSNPPSQKDDSGSHKEGSSGSSPHSEDVPLPPDNRLSFTGMANGGASAGPANKSYTWAGTNWLAGGNAGAAPTALGKPPPGRDPKSRARSREYLKQCLQEISYLTSPQAMNPLPNRPLINNATLPLTLPNVPSFDQMAYNGRPRKIVPEVGKDFPVMNGMSLMSGPSTAPASNANQIPLLERDMRLNTGNVGSYGQTQNAQTITSQLNNYQHPQVQLVQSNMQSQPPVPAKDKEGDEFSEPQSLTSIFRPDDAGEWKERLRLSHEAAERARAIQGVPPVGSGASSWEGAPKEFDEDAREMEPDLEDDEASAIGEDDSKLWKPRRTLRNHLDAVRAVAFHPTEMCLATGGDDSTVKIWRMDAAGLASSATRVTTEVEPQLTLRGHSAPVTRLIHSAAKGLLYSASLDSSIRVWALPPASHTTYAPFDSSRARGELVGHTDAVWDLILVRDDNLLISCGAEGAVKVWEVATPERFGQLKLTWGYNGLDSEDENAVPSELPGASALEAIKSDLKTVAVAYQNSVIKLFDIDTGKQSGILEWETNPENLVASQVNCLASHPTMPILVAGHEDKHIRLFDVTTGQCTHSMVAHLDAVTSISIDTSGFSLVSGSHDCSLRFWDLLGSRTCVQEITAHREKGGEGVLAVEFHPSLPFIVSSGADGVVKLFASSQ